jgi:hypothetical protein
MGISINPLSLLEFLLNRRFKTKEKVVEYIESIADDAEGLARVWGQIVDGLQRKDSVTVSDRQIRELEKYKEPNAPYFSRLMEFYSYLSVAVGGKLEDRWHENIAECLGQLIYFRKLTFQEYLKAIDRLSVNSTFLDEDNRSADLKDIVQSVSVLQKEAAKIRVLAKTIRTL